ncbi:DUF4127 family protein [Clostridium hydrogeniformans]|uniref:DUF4127 family protein n=1 Tax=Clostridium hydrogeniformans TaxID=349933 RepID=UPI000482A49D|nr:DUF4127 family protein [Clostridium hydrogeniformans]
MEKIVYISKTENRDLKDLCSISLDYEIVHIKDLKELKLINNIIGFIISVDDFNNEIHELEKVITNLKKEKSIIAYGFSYNKDFNNTFLDYHIKDKMLGVHILLLTKLFNEINNNNPLVYVKNTEEHIEDEIIKAIEITGGIKIDSMEESDILFFINNSEDNLLATIEYLYDSLMTYGKSIGLLDNSFGDKTRKKFIELLKEKDLLREIMSYSYKREEYNLQYSLSQSMIAWLYGNNKINKELKTRIIEESSKA